MPYTPIPRSDAAASSERLSLGTREKRDAALPDRRDGFARPLAHRQRIAELIDRSGAARYGAAL